jgi:hypothetical protein
VPGRQIDGDKDSLEHDEVLRLLKDLQEIITTSCSTSSSTARTIAGVGSAPGCHCEQPLPTVHNVDGSVEGKGSQPAGALPADDIVALGSAGANDADGGWPAHRSMTSSLRKCVAPNSNDSKHQAGRTRANHLEPVLAKQANQVVETGLG